MDGDDDISASAAEVGSDELLSDDYLRLPDSANPLVRVHAVRAWLKRRQKDTEREIGLAALEIQDLQTEDPDAPRLRRHEQQLRMAQVQRVQQTFQDARQRLSTYEDAEEVLEDCVNHVTVSERLLVEYYLTLEELVQNSLQDGELEASPRVLALQDVQQRVERVGAPNEE